MKAFKLRKYRSDVKLVNNTTMKTLHFPNACRRKLKMALVDSAIVSHAEIAQKTGLEKNIVFAWMLLFRRAVPFRKHDSYLADFDGKDSVSLFCMIH